MPSFFVKFSYNQAIKKVHISQEELTWENVCSILMKSFYLAEKDKIKLKYKDLEDDEITVSSDGDLAEAYNLYFMKNLIKFFVYYSGVFGQDAKLQNTGYSKIERSGSFSGLSISNKEASISRKISDNGVDRSAEKNQVIDAIEISPKNVTEVKSEPVHVKVDPIEFQNIFSEVFSTTEVLQKIKEKLSNYISKENSNSDALVEYTIDTDYQAITNHLVSTFNNLMNEKVVKDLAAQQSIENKEEEKKVDQKNIIKKDDRRGLLDVSLSESIYGNTTREPIYTSIKEHADPKITSFNSSSIECKDLGSTLGVKLVLKYENGKAKFVSIPSYEYSIIEKSPNTGSEKIKNNNEALQSIKEKQADFEEVDLKEENLEESICNNVVLSLKKRASTTEKKASEFSNKMLKANLHDLDEDLPAPYDKKLVQKYEKGIKDSMYEKIE